MSNHTDSLADQGAALRLASAGRLPEQVAATFEAEREAMIGRGVPDRTAAPGTAMPDGELLDVHGEPTTLTAARAGRPAVVVFYRGAWCPYCNLTLRHYQATLVAELEARGIVLVAVSPQTPDGSLSVAEKNELTFTVLSDPGNRIADRLGLTFTPGADARAAQQRLGVDLADLNADGTAVLPLTTAVLVDAAGTIRWIDVRPDYTSRSESAEILAAADAL
ncbi:peroxiredoxin-like family protein [Kitasatospora sp. NPDC089797]|uniref:peroxiredoxin-like family protein n=1 Tax=Kitasatospora sp. NPDC089797 TaxID=3155298 RepID=UPI00342B8AD2